MGKGKLSLTTFLFLFLCVFVRVQSQVPVRFEVLTKLKTWSMGKGYAYDGQRIIVCPDRPNNIFFWEFETYQVYNFKGNSWENINFPIKTLNKSARSLPSSIAEFLPGKNMIVTMGDPIEFLDLANFRLSGIKIEGDFPWSCGSAVWKDKIYFFGGTWASNENAIMAYNRSPTPPRGRPLMATSYNLLTQGSEITDQAFVFDDMAFTELERMPDKRYTLGKFIGNNLYTLGGNHNAISFNDIFRYNPILNSWSIYGHLPHAVYQNSIATDGIYIYITGVNGGVGYLGIYDPITNAYREYNTNIAFKSGALVVHENAVYFFAGRLPEDIRSVEHKVYKLSLSNLPPSPWISCRDN